MNTWRWRRRPGVAWAIGSAGRVAVVLLPTAAAVGVLAYGSASGDTMLLWWTAALATGACVLTGVRPFVRRLVVLSALLRQHREFPAPPLARAVVAWRWPTTTEAWRALDALQGEAWTPETQARRAELAGLISAQRGVRGSGELLVSDGRNDLALQVHAGDLLGLHDVSRPPSDARRSLLALATAAITVSVALGMASWTADRGDQGSQFADGGAPSTIGLPSTPVVPTTPAPTPPPTTSASATTPQPTRPATTSVPEPSPVGASPAAASEQSAGGSATRQAQVVTGGADAQEASAAPPVHRLDVAPETAGVEGLQALTAVSVPRAALVQVASTPAAPADGLVTRVATISPAPVAPTATVPLRTLARLSTSDGTASDDPATAPSAAAAFRGRTLDGSGRPGERHRRAGRPEPSGRRPDRRRRHHPSVLTYRRELEHEHADTCCAGRWSAGHHGPRRRRFGGRWYRTARTRRRCREGRGPRRAVGEVVRALGPTGRRARKSAARALATLSSSAAVGRGPPGRDADRLGLPTRQARGGALDPAGQATWRRTDLR